MRMIYIFLLVSVLFLTVTGCNNGENYKYARKPHIMYNDKLYGLSASLPKSHTYESMSHMLIKVGVIEESVPTSELPNSNFQVNYEGYVGAEVYINIDGNKETIYLRINKDLEDDKLIRFDIDSNTKNND